MSIFNPYIKILHIPRTYQDFFSCFPREKTLKLY